MQGAGEQLLNAISTLEEKVRQHQGEIAFCLREFTVHGEVTGDFIPPIPHEYHHYDTGIIIGEVQKNEEPEVNIIKLPHISLRPMGTCDPNDYIWGNYSIPVDRNVRGFVNTFGNLRFDIGVEVLEGLKPGQILLDFKDFEDSTLLALLDRDRTSHLTRTDILVGNEEVEKFLSERRIGNYQELLSILKNPIVAEGKISEHYSQEAGKLGREIVITANEVANAYRKLKALEESVMHATLSLDYDDGHRYPVWDNFHRENIDKYQGLKEVVSKTLKVLNKQLSRAEDPKLFKSVNFHFLDGEVIGLHARVLVSDQVEYLKKTMIPEIEGTFAKIDSYLAEQRKKVSH